MELTTEHVAKRQSEFPQLIREISFNNASVYKIIELYSHGMIVSKEEAYCQMVKELAVSYEQMFKRLVDEANMKTVLWTKDLP